MVSTSSLDANIIVRYITGDIPTQRELVKKLLATPNSTFYLSDLALSEVVYVFATVYEKPREEIVNLLNFFLSRYNNIIYNRELTSSVFPFYLTHSKLSFNDCCLAYYAEATHHEPLFTFDRKLANQSPSAKLLA